VKRKLERGLKIEYTYRGRNENFEEIHDVYTR
jgi:hypothetical protein